MSDPQTIDTMAQLLRDIEQGLKEAQVGTSARAAPPAQITARRPVPSSGQRASNDQSRSEKSP